MSIVRFLALALLSLAPVTAVACGGDDSPAAPVGPPPAPGFSRVTGNGFTIDMPSGWQQPALDPEAFARTAAALRERNPQLAKALEEARAEVGTGSRVFAIDPDDGSSVNLIVTTTGGRSLDDFVGQAIRELQQVGVSDLRRDETSIGGRPATRLAFGLAVTGESGTVAVPEEQYYVARSDTLFIVTLFGDSPGLAIIAESLRFG
ncbi:MAG: hypothetical protein ABR540_16960 [Acidimicrobiales bacterium]